MTHRNPPLIAVALLLLALACPGFCPGARADLASDVQSVVKDKSLTKAEIGVQIIRIGETEPADRAISDTTPTSRSSPASNLKLVTTSAALDKLGSDFKFRTLLLKHNDDLVLIGDGDPSLGDAELLRKSGWDVTTVFKNWADQLRKANLTAFKRVVIDDSIFDDQFAHRNWPADQLHKRYVAQIAGLNLNGNCVDFYLRVTTSGEMVKYLMSPRRGTSA
jgi:D-alanyl-D-alanine carboxypeptidase/D-alanyl-D-alanine-endopeptidase (penicillin-binding protein 4)